MDVKENQRVAIKFCFEVDLSATNTVELIQKAYGDETLSRTKVFEWHKLFREGRESVKEDERSGRPTTSRTDDNIATIDKMIKGDRNVTSRLIADTLGIPKTVVLRILRDDMKKIKRPGKFGSKNSTVYDSKTSRNIEPPPPPILAIFVSPWLLSVSEGEVAAEGCKIWYNWKIQKPVTDQLNKIPAEVFSNATKKLETRANLCNTSNGSYFE